MIPEQDADSGKVDSNLAAVCIVYILVSDYCDCMMVC